MTDTDLYRVERRDNGAGHAIAWLTDGRGVTRKASEAEAVLWDALQAAREQLQRQAKKGAK